MRVANRVGAVLLGLVLMALGVLTVIETFAVTFWNRSWPFPVRSWRADLEATRWSDGWVLTTAIIVFGVGAVLVVLQLWRVRPQRVGAAWNTSDQTWLITRRGVERQAAVAAQTVAGVGAAHAVASGSPRHWRVAVKASADDGAVDAGQVEVAVRNRLALVGAPADVPVHVTVRHARSHT